MPIKLYAGLPIAQLSFMALDRPAERPYGSPELGCHYQGQVAATGVALRRPARGAVAFRAPCCSALITFAAEEAAEEPVQDAVLRSAAALLARVGRRGLARSASAAHETFAAERQSGAARA